MSELKYVQTAHLTDGHAKGITSVTFNCDASLFATSGLDGAVCIWDTKTWSLLDIYYAKTRVASLAWYTEEALICGLEDGVLSSLVKVRDPESAQSSLTVSGFNAHRLPVEHLSVSGTLVAAGAQEDVGIWYWDTNAEKACLAKSLPLPVDDDQLEQYADNDSNDEHDGEDTTSSEILVTGVFWDASYLIVTYLNHGIRFFSRETWKLAAVIDLKSQIVSASLSPNGGFLAATNLEAGFDIYDLNAGKIIRTFEHECGQLGRAIPVSFIHGGHAVVSGSVAGRVNVWFVDSGRKIILPIPNGEKVLAVAGYDFKADRFIIATGLMNEESSSSVIIWSAGASSVAEDQEENHEKSPAIDLVEGPHDDRDGRPSVLLIAGYVIFVVAIIAGMARARWAPNTEYENSWLNEL